jgi:DNA-binding protein H-NS
MASVNELLAQKAAIEKQIAEAQREQRAEALSKIRSLMSEYGLSVADLSGRSAAGTRVSTGSKVAPKYRDPQTGNTWSGRGLKPKWLSSALAEGKQLEDFKL